MKIILILSILLGAAQTFACAPFVATWACVDADGTKWVDTYSAIPGGLKIDSSNEEPVYFDGRPQEVLGSEAQTKVSCNGNQFIVTTTFGYKVPFVGEYKSTSDSVLLVNNSTLTVTTISKEFKVVDGKDIEDLESRGEPEVTTCTKQ